MADGIFTPKPGEHDSMACDICGAVMDVAHNVMGPTSFAESMSGKAHLHDRFSCSYREQRWHKQAVALRHEAETTASKRLADMLMEEFTEIIRTRNPTKERFEG